MVGDLKELMYGAYCCAAMSPDPSNQNGAVILTREDNIYNGCNSFGDYPWTDAMLQDRDKKLAFIEHAERAAIYEAARHEALRDAMMVVPWAACTDCGRAIARSGIKKVVVHRKRMETTPERWIQSVKDGLSFLEHYGVALFYLDEPLDVDFTIKVNGSDWNP